MFHDLPAPVNPPAAANPPAPVNPAPTNPANPSPTAVANPAPVSGSAGATPSAGASSGATNASPSTGPSPTGTGAGTGSGSSAQPIPSSGESMETVGATDPRIQYHGQWTTVGSTCAANGRQTTHATDSFTITIPSASRIYLDMDRSTGVSYDIYVNGSVSTVSPNPNAETCIYEEVPLSSSSSSNVNVTVVVLGTTTQSMKRQVGGWDCQLNSIIVMHSGSSGGPPTNDAVKAQQFKTLWLGLGAILLIGFDLVF
ncbi:hypothetical protein NP233_g4650 [Leucocoprinus birnbaumii]|uniref:Uncharacterized protein n=1 Tax=Leucocoprinus birnbaumii TaxID=56174 RepID=A0AAD5VUC1_9AGAR|nr:hypothetical protein NP233_g4650 [Leucocoprinus birnbaumii]